ncbi:MAG: hypothetical protein QOI41_4194, partial [Myxococcales bacterium]|nr:hypothetical protein [Myxococcales bacterium]
RALAAERYDAPEMRATYMTFDVEYLSALPPGATAARPVDTGVTRPAGLWEMSPPTPPSPMPAPQLAAFDSAL